MVYRGKLRNKNFKKNNCPNYYRNQKKRAKGQRSNQRNLKKKLLNRRQKMTYQLKLVIKQSRILKQF